jgi:hypothetical protein
MDTQPLRRGYTVPLEPLSEFRDDLDPNSRLLGILLSWYYVLGIAIIAEILGYVYFRTQFSQFNPYGVVERGDFATTVYVFSHYLFSSSISFTILATLSIAVLVSRAFYRAALEEARRNWRIRALELARNAEPGKATPAWDLARVTLDAYFRRNLSQINIIYYVSIGVMVVGFSLVAWSLYFRGTVPTTGTTNWASVAGAAAGVITQFIGATFLLVYRSALQQASGYTATLERINSVGMAMQILDTMPDNAPEADLKSHTKAVLTTLLVQGANKLSASELEQLDVGDKAAKDGSAKVADKIAST